VTPTTRWRRTSDESRSRLEQTGIRSAERALLSRLNRLTSYRWFAPAGAAVAEAAQQAEPEDRPQPSAWSGEGATQEEIEKRLLELLKRYEGRRILSLDYPPSYDFRPRWGYSRPLHQKLIELFARNRDRYLGVLEEMVALEPYFLQIADQFSHERPGEPGWIGGPINPLDTALLYYFVARYKPRTYLEIGSGVTTLFAARAKRDHHLPTAIVSIDPSPRTWVDQVCDHIIREPFETTDLSAFEKLEPGDIVFMDGSHRTFMNSDVTVFMLDVLPALKPGVIVHFHDILWPYDYPPTFQDWYWSEQYVVAAYLLGAAEKVDVLMPSRFVSDLDELKVILAPILARWHGPTKPWLNGGSLWFTHRDTNGAIRP
jgi:hypothetical protein